MLIVLRSAIITALTVWGFVGFMLFTIFNTVVGSGLSAGFFILSILAWLGVFIYLLLLARRDWNG